MDRTERKECKRAAAEALASGTYCPKKLVLIHTAVSSSLALLVALVTFLLDHQIAGTTGLSGMGSQAILETAQQILQLAMMLVLPFWSVGLLQCFLRIHRREPAEPKTLLTGFLWFGPVLRTLLLQALVLCGAAFLGGYVSMFLYTMTPLYRQFYEAVAPYMVDGVVDFNAILADKACIDAMLWPILFTLLGAFVAVIPVYYRLRVANYILLDHPEKGALFALRASKTLMRGKRFDLFKLDLSFWWFYGLEALVTVICYGDVALNAFGVDLGLSQTVLFFGFYVLALVLQLGLYVWKQPLLQATYAGYYDALLPQTQPDATQEGPVF